MPLTGAQRSRIVDALLAAYSRDELRKMVTARMNVDFVRHVSAEKAYEAQVFEFVEWGDRQGRALELLEFAASERKQNTGLQALWAEAQGWNAETQPDEAPVASPPTGAAPVQDAPMVTPAAQVTPPAPIPPKPQPRWLWWLLGAAAVVLVIGGVALLLPKTDGDGGTPITPTPTQSVQSDAAPTDLPTEAPLVVPESAPAPTASEMTATETAQAAVIGAITTTIRTNTKDGAEYVYVPEGVYTIGTGQSDPMAYDDEKPPTPVPLAGFWIMRTEVTNAQYAACAEVDACTGANSDTWQDPIYADYPVTYVTWHQAAKYAAWVGGRLPTEAEWEAACRGMDGNVYPWGNETPAPNAGNFGGSDGTMPVGSFPDGASPFGALDMAGNVWEWTSTLFADYPYNPDDGREDPDAAGVRVVRGGSFLDSVGDVRCSVRDRNQFPPSTEDGNGGFRIVSDSLD